jgi:hypothetical protein
MENELKTNAKNLSQSEQYQIRKSIVRLLKSGKTGKEIAKLLVHDCLKKSVSDFG